MPVAIKGWDWVWGVSMRMMEGCQGGRGTIPRSMMMMMISRPDLGGRAASHKAQPHRIDRHGPRAGRVLWVGGVGVGLCRDGVGGWMGGREAEEPFAAALAFRAAHHNARSSTTNGHPHSRSFLAPCLRNFCYGMNLERRGRRESEGLVGVPLLLVWFHFPVKAPVAHSQDLSFAWPDLFFS